MTGTSDTSAAVTRPATRRARIIVFAIDVVVLVAFVPALLLVRSGLRANDPLSIDRLVESTTATLFVFLITVPLMLLLCGRYSGRPDALELRRTATGVLLAAAVISAWSVRGDQAWWLFMPAVGAVSLIAAFTLAARLAAALQRR